MAKSRKNPGGEESTETTEAPPAAVSAASTAALVALGVLAALWALVLWAELALARAGSTPFCSIDAQVDCLRVWDAPFASAVHRLTRIPVAGWGVAWGLVAAALPLFLLLRLAQGDPVARLLSATRIHAGAGLIAAFVLAAVSFGEGALCLGCLGTYALVGAYGAIALFTWKHAGLPDARGGALMAGAGMLAALLLLLYPGTRTPGNAADASRAAIQASRETTGSVGEVPVGTPPPAPGLGPSPLTGSSPIAAAPIGGSPSPAALGPVGSGDAGRDARLGEFVASLPPELKQQLSNALDIYRNSPRLAMKPPRALQGSPLAPVRITEFTDVLCSHCATLHATMAGLRAQLPKDSFNVDARQYPLDSRCNPQVQGFRGDPVRCVASLARICLEKTPHADAFAGAIFSKQASLTLDGVYDLAAPYRSRAELEACVTSAEARKRLDEDVAYATEHHAEGTPLVLVNGRRGTAFSPFLFAIVLAGGRERHPAFDTLPPAMPRAHMH